ncbi:hypothetical protein ANANG_G00120380 [Anguilla anguilla]|uniref:Uncharacterized protein n=1 Tax=Anguilla anguilla TaxID=7936 RepID=A0A9D3MG69_ANGAN|nr:hypothetical protein ANANG_G00120380 [Anguilla anguilla]
MVLTIQSQRFLIFHLTFHLFSIFAFSRLVERPDWKSRDQGSQPTTKLAGSVSAGSPRRIPLLNLPHSH